MDIILLVGQFIVGLLIILKGADWLTDGATFIAQRFKISTMVIGLTIVAFGTSTPELVISLLSAIEGQSEIALGNVVGSNVFNSLAIMGITAMISPIAVKKNTIRYDIPLCILISLVLFIMASDTFISGETADLITRSEGITLLAFFAIFMAYSFAIAKSDEKTDKARIAKAEAAGKHVEKKISDEPVEVAPMWKSVMMIIIGLGCLVFGGEWLVNGASGIASLLGISESVIALTIVGAGTSAPELVTSIVAARKGDTDMAMGNVVGSSMFNIVAILGITSLLCPLSLGSITTVDFGVLLFSAVALWLCCRFGKRLHIITRFEGFLLTACMVAYYVYLINACA